MFREQSLRENYEKYCMGDSNSIDLGSIIKRLSKIGSVLGLWRSVRFYADEASHIRVGDGIQILSRMAIAF